MADPFAVLETARGMFPGVPRAEVLASMPEVCGHDGHANPHIAYCTSDVTIYLSEAFETRPGAAYEMAHVLGHAMQVRHGVADVALRAIRNRRDEEAALRGMVTRQVDCVAGVFLARSGQPLPDLAAIYGAEPMTGSHWGRNPLRSGPRVSIGLRARQDWVVRGYEANDIAACTAGEMSSELLVNAQRDG